MSDRDDLDAIIAGGKRALAAALTRIETAFTSEAVTRLLDAAERRAKGRTIGLTGPPGVGKSTLTDALVRRYRADRLTVGVLAVDPSSQRSGGALLGDRTRITTAAGDDGAFVRSLAARGALGGLSDVTFPSLVLMRAIFDRVIVESVGVGQSEADIRGVTDTVVLCVQPGSGDSLQFMKAGIMEIPDIAVVTKADQGPLAERALGELAGALSLGSGEERRVPALAISATTGAGLDDLVAALEAHWSAISARDGAGAIRRAQSVAWLERRIEREFGARGLAGARGFLEPLADEGPFTTARRVGALLTAALEAGLERAAQEAGRGGGAAR
ncbi:MAG: methylmalonyl Co-A mutase-associated GTPase MeaB [Rhizobiales bacterium]|nr:methylmalonyl Co-A mutase-associated GTPase MeaB [Hyphomicrobiales bacterium]